MSEQTHTVLHLAGHSIWPGAERVLGSLALTEDEIITYAKFCDPLPFHIDPEHAKGSVFGGIVASGSQLFVEFHKRWFIPMFSSSMVAGLSIDHWTFHQPHFPDRLITGTLHTLDLIPKPEKRLAIVHWKYTFHDEHRSLIQSAEFKVMHRPDPNPSQQP
jgi:acyl dehydratase